jgi:hypothetical protein
MHLPLLLADPLVLRGLEYPCDVEFELAEIDALRESREIVPLQYFHKTHAGWVSDYRTFPYGLTNEPDGSWGQKVTCVVDFQRIN